MPKGFLPNADARLLQWSRNFCRRIVATPGAYGLLEAQALSYLGVHEGFAAAYAAALDPALRTRVLVKQKNAAREALRTAARNLSRIVQGQAAVTDAQKIELGLSVRRRPRPIARPTTAPRVCVEAVVGRTVKARLFDREYEGRGKPPGVDAALVFSFVSEDEPPADLGGWKLETSTGRTVVRVSFPAALPPGTKVWLAAYWLNPRKQAGPVSRPVSAYLAGGLSIAA